MDSLTSSVITNLVFLFTVVCKLNSLFSLINFIIKGFLFPVITIFIDSIFISEMLVVSILEICKMLEIEVNVLEASCCEVPPETSGQERVISICKALKAKAYINPISGTKLYSSTEFYNNSISLNFIQPNLQLYKQYHNKFIPNLSVLDTLMFVDKATIIKMCNNDFTIL